MQTAIVSDVLTKCQLTVAVDETEFWVVDGDSIVECLNKRLFVVVEVLCVFFCPPVVEVTVFVILAAWSS